MIRNFPLIYSRHLLFALIVLVATAGCAQYRCYDGTYVEDAYDCFGHGGLSYFSRSIKRKASKTLSGTWSIEGNVTSKACPTINNAVSTSIRITEQGNGGLTIRSLAGYGTVTTKLLKNRVRFRVKKNAILYSVDSSVDATFASDKNSAQLVGKGTVGFLGGKSCDVTLSAKAAKN